jgi:phosphoribosylformylglycinamidine synthase subunit PurQ / glutaminase
VPALNGAYGTQATTLTFNDSGTFEDRWAYLTVNEKSPCIFTRGLTSLYLPVRHGEGKFIPGDAAVLNELQDKNLVVAQYTDRSCEKAVMDYPLNPNGSVEAIAGICDETGRVFGMMPHPEAYLHYTNHPRWTREPVPEEGMGVAIFRNAIEYLRKNM